MERMQHFTLIIRCPTIQCNLTSIDTQLRVFRIGQSSVLRQGILKSRNKGPCYEGICKRELRRLLESQVAKVLTGPSGRHPISSDNWYADCFRNKIALWNVQLQQTRRPRSSIRIILHTDLRITIWLPNLAQSEEQRQTHHNAPKCNAYNSGQLCPWIPGLGRRWEPEKASWWENIC